MPVDMSFGAPWAGYFLGFEQDESQNNYTSVEKKHMWQSLVGYTPIYDFFFSLGGPIRRFLYEFEVTNDGPLPDIFQTDYYVVWIWKGDYWNLGAGAEIGIYHTDCYLYHKSKFYDVVTDLTLDVDMTIIYQDRELTHLVQTNWWVCSFTPEEQLINIDDLRVSLKVKFTDPSLRDPFYNAWQQREQSETIEDNWDHISFSVEPPYDDSNINNYQFELDY